MKPAASSLLDGLVERLVEQLAPAMLARVVEGITERIVRDLPGALGTSTPAGGNGAAPGRRSRPARTAPVVAPTRAAPAGRSASAPTTKVRGGCSKCGKAGHNARSCGRKPKGGKHKAADQEGSMRAPEPAERIVSTFAPAVLFTGGSVPSEAALAVHRPTRAIATASAPPAPPIVAVAAPSRTQRPPAGIVNTKRVIAGRDPSGIEAAHNASNVSDALEAMNRAPAALFDLSRDLGFTPCRLECGVDEIHEAGTCGPRRRSRDGGGHRSPAAPDRRARIAARAEGLS